MLLQILPFVILVFICDDLQVVTSCVTCQFSSCARDCRELYEIGFTTSGVYTVYPAELLDGFDVYCDMETEKGGWLVIQRRENGSVDFNRTWDDYQFGFGHVAGEFWLGNYQIHLLTAYYNYELRIELENWESEERFAQYKLFRVGDSTKNYTLAVEGYSGNAGDSLILKHNGKQFSTIDKDRDDANGNCAEMKRSGWWFENCAHANLNGFYYTSSNNTYKGRGIFWSTWEGWYYSLTRAEMKIRRK